jgi:hypothetical protein
VVDCGAWHDPFAEADPPTYHQNFVPPGRYPVTDTALLFPEPGLSDHLGLSARIALTSPPPAPH